MSRPMDQWNSTDIANFCGNRGETPDETLRRMDGVNSLRRNVSADGPWKHPNRPPKRRFSLAVVIVVLLALVVLVALIAALAVEVTR